MVQSQLINDLQNVLGRHAVVVEPDALRTYDADASWIVAHAPQVVVLPQTSEQTATVVRMALQAGMPIVARGAGTGIAGGAIPLHGGMLVSTARMERILAVETDNRRAIVQPGLVNAELNAYLAGMGFQFAPDPSSQKASTIGGNLGNNAGGPHCLKYGVTTNHVLAVEIVLADGSLIWTGDGIADAAGYDLTGLVVGSEGTFGIVTQVMVRLTPLPEANRVVLALFPSVVAASTAVSKVIAAGSLPTSLEVMDHNAIRAVNGAYGLGLPEDQGTTLLIVEVDGVADGIEDQLQEILDLCRAAGAFELRPARTSEEQARVWTARKAVAAAIGRLAPAYYLVDAVVPRTRLPMMMEYVEQLRREHDLEVCNVFHAGDGNLHPLVLYDPRDADQSRRAHMIAAGVLDLSIEQGGVISGEHGIGVEKCEYLPRMFSPSELQLHATLAAVFNPQEVFNPAKIFPPDQPPGELAAARRERIATNGASAVDLRDRLQTIVGAEHLLVGGATAAYGIRGVTPDYAVFPADIEQLAAVMAACHRASATVVPWGGGTRQHLGNPLEAQTPLVVVGTGRLRRVTTYEPDDLTIGIEAGMPLAELQAHLAEYGQMLPLTIADGDQSTIGGLVATAATGSRRTGYGTLRDWLLGITLVEVDGTISRLGAQVVKNVTGYDLVRLCFGSYGTLGIIAGVSLKIFPQPRQSATLQLEYADRSAALAFVKELAHTQLQPTAVDYLHGVTLPAGSTPLYHTIAIRSEGHPAAVKRHLHDIAQRAASNTTVPVAILRDDAETEHWAALSRAMTPRAIAADEMVLRVAVLPAQLDAALTRIEQTGTAEGLSITIVAQALQGVLLVRARGNTDGLRRLHATLNDTFSHIHLLDADDALRRTLATWGTTPATLAIMARIRTALDPDRRMNPGRFLV
jgi:D-lactate dehydrogenase (cytochrome)